MITVIDANGVPLPSFASLDPSRIPPPLIPTVTNDTAMGDVAKSLDAISKRLDALESRRSSPVTQGFECFSGQQAEAQKYTYTSHNVSSDCTPQAQPTPANVMPPVDQVQVQAVRDKQSVVGTASRGDVPAFISAVEQANKVFLPVRIGTSSNDSGKVKAVLRELA